MIDKERLSLRAHTITDINELCDELELNWRIVYDDATLEITYEDELVALLNLGDRNIYNGPYIEQFEVLNTFKNKGFGTAIIKKLLSETEECYVLPESEKAVRFWEKLEFNKEYDGVGEYVWHYTIVQTD